MVDCQLWPCPSPGHQGLGSVNRETEGLLSATLLVSKLGRDIPGRLRVSELAHKPEALRSSREGSGNVGVTEGKKNGDVTHSVSPEFESTFSFASSAASRGRTCLVAAILWLCL